MSATTGERILQQLTWRYATKKFDPKRTISEADWTTLQRALILAPSSFGLQPWRFIVITDPGVKARLPAISWGQEQVRDASHVVVFAGRTRPDAADVDRHIDRVAAVRGAPRDALKGYRDMMAGFVENPAPGLDLAGWAARQVYIALGVFLTAAAMLGIDACPMEGLDPNAYDAELGLAGSGYGTLCVAAAGYRAADDKYANLAKVRYEASDVIKRL